MTPEQLEQRVRAIELRLERLEQRESPERVPAPMRAAAEPTARTGPTSASIATGLLGWGGAFALVLAAAYLIRLAIDVGWLTPERQVLCAGAGGLSLVLVGLMFGLRDRSYAGLLPAAGIAILYLTVYGAQLHYHLIGTGAALLLIGVIAAGSLALYRLFRSDLYVLFAVAGSYSAPFLLAAMSGSLAQLALYFLVWGVAFSAFALWHARRAVYLLALYLALLGFEVARERLGAAPFGALALQSVQLALFALTALLLSARRGAMSRQLAYLHLPALALFYALQYRLLHEVAPAAAAWIALASALAAVLLYLAVGRALRAEAPAGRIALWFYVSMTLFHAGYLQLLPATAAPWVALLAPVLLAWLCARRDARFEWSWPAWAAVGLIFAARWWQLLAERSLPVPSSLLERSLLGAGYASLFYVAYGLARQRHWRRPYPEGLLVLGHATAMIVTLQVLAQAIVQSVVWALIALLAIGVSLLRRDRWCGQSALLVFAATAGKVVLYDLRGSAALVRIVSLAILGVTFYVAGLLYRRAASAIGGP